MESTPPRDPLARERERQRRTQQIQRRRLVFGLIVLGLIVLVVAIAVGLSGDSTTPGGTTSTSLTGSTSTSLTAATYAADLTGAESIPPLPTKATGTFTLTYDPAAALTFVLEINGLTNPSIATINEGTTGNTGGVVLTLFNGPTEDGLYSGKLASGAVTDADLTGTLQGKTIGDLIAMIAAGNAYVNVGNTSHPTGAIRGQIK